MEHRGGGGRERKTGFVDSQLWHACAGSMVQMPSLNTNVFYFPQGHLEHAAFPSSLGAVAIPRAPPAILCRIAAVRFMADPETDEVYARIGLIPLAPSPPPPPAYGLYDGFAGIGADRDGFVPNGGGEKPNSFAKTLTQSDANNGGGFSVPRYCAETIFPRLDYSAEPPVQTVSARDVHGEVWKFRHIYRGTPRRHLLTTGWSAFVNQKKLVAGDSIVFLRAENGEIFVGVRRVKRVGVSSPGGQAATPPSRGFPVMLREGGRSGYGGGAEAEVAEAVAFAAAGRSFEALYYPRKGTPEFVVREGAVRAAMRVQWGHPMRFKMPFETEDSSRVSWFMGTISGVKVVDPVNWPASPWRMLQVLWDEPDLLPNVKCVNPWLVELVSNIPTIHHFSPYSSPRKKLRFPQHPDFPFDGHFLSPSLTISPFGQFRNLCSTGMQGARHTPFGVLSSSVHVTSNGYKFHLQDGLIASPSPGKSHDSRASDSPFISGQTDAKENNISCVLTIGSSEQESVKPEKKAKPTQFLLFGQSIPIQPPTSSNSNSSGVTSAELSPHKASSEIQTEAGNSWQASGLGSGACSGHCKVFMESEDVGRIIDLSMIRSYEELYQTLGAMFGEEKSGMLTRVLYHDSSGAVRHAGCEPFSEFRRVARRITITVDPGNKNLGRMRLSGMWNADNGFSSSNKVHPLSTPA